MGRKKNTYKPHSFESAGGKNGKHDTFSALYSSMVHHPAYQSLKPRQMKLYDYCKERLYGFKKPKMDFPNIPELQGDTLFYFSLSDAVETGLYKSSMRREFYNDMQILEEHGLIRKVVSDKAAKKKNIYEFSDRWKIWRNL